MYDIGAPHLCANVIHWQTAASGLTTTQLTQVQSTFDTNWWALWKQVAATTSQYNGSIVTDMSSNTGLQVGNAGYTPKAGTVSGGPLSDGTAALLSLITGVRYRGGHGRIYLPGVGIGITNSDGRNISSTYLGLLSTAWTTLTNAMGAIAGTYGGPYQAVVWHKHLSSAPNTTEIAFSMTPQPVLATQRRRLRKVPRHKRH